MGVEIPRFFEMNGEVIDAEGVRWANRNPALSRWFREQLIDWIADRMEEAEEDTSVCIDYDDE